MPKSRFITAVVAVVALIALPDAVSAAPKKKKLSYEEAWKRCQPEVNKLPGDQHSQRMARGSACMKKLGHKI